MWGMKYSVCETRQTSGGGDYIVKYDADLELLPNGTGIVVEVLSTIPANADPKRVEITRQCIRKGVEAALESRGQGCILRLSGLAIHPVDFKPKRFEQVTSHELLQALAATKNS
jgi:hypothetical protein